MLNNIFVFLLNITLQILCVALLLRFLMQLFKAPFHNPLSQVTVALTDFIVKPVRRWIPSWKKIDLSTLLLAFITQLLLYFSLQALNASPNSHVVIAALLGLIHTILDIFFYAIIIQAVLSWINPHSPISGVLHSLTDPILAPIRRFVPMLGGMDFSPLVAIILIQMVNIVLMSI